MINEAHFKTVAQANTVFGTLTRSGLQGGDTYDSCGTAVGRNNSNISGGNHSGDKAATRAPLASNDAFPSNGISRFDPRRATAELDKIIDDLLNFTGSAGLHALRNRVTNSRSTYGSEPRAANYSVTCSSTPQYRATGAVTVRQYESDSGLVNKPSLSQCSTTTVANALDDADYYQRRWMLLHGATPGTTVRNTTEDGHGGLSARLNGSSALHARQIDMLRMQANQDVSLSNSGSSTYQNSSPNKVQQSVSPLHSSDPQRTAVQSDLGNEKPAQEGRSRQYQTVRVECFEEVESIGLEPIGKGVHDLASPVVAVRNDASAVAPSNAPAKPTGFVQHDVEVMTLQPIGRGVRDLSRPGPRHVTMATVLPQHSATRSPAYQPQRQGAVNFTVVPKPATKSTPTREDIRMHMAPDSSSKWASSGTLASTGRHTLPMTTGVWPRRLSSAQCSPGRTSSSAGSSVALAVPEDVQRRLLMVQDRSRWWFKPNMPREELVRVLLSLRVGSFLIRKSGTYPGSFGLAVRVDRPVSASATKEPEKDLIRHFLIEPTPKGVRLRGFANEPVFTSLAALVYQHTVSPLGLPCCLILPDFDPAPEHSELYQSSASLLSTGKSPPDGNLAKAQVAGILNSIESLASTGQNADTPGLTTTLIYVGSIDVESLSGPQAVARAFVELQNSFKRGLCASLTEIKLTINSNGVVITDINRRLFFRKHLPLPSILHCGTDPDDRRLTDLTKKGGSMAKLLGIVARKQSGPLNGAAMYENVCYLFAEMAQSIPIAGIVSFLCQFVHSTTAH